MQTISFKYNIGSLSSIRIAAFMIGLGSALCCAGGLAAETQTTKTIQAVRIDTPPTIDGILDDAVWQLASIVEDLHEVSPNEFSETSVPSRFYVLYGSDALYVAVRMWDSNPDNVIAQVLSSSDISFGDDSVSIILDPHNNGRSGYMFDLNPNGVRHEALFTDVTQENWAWRGIWHGAARKDSEGWSAEFEIPFKTLSFDPANDTWGINFTRWRGRLGEFYGWVSYNSAVNPANSGKLEGLVGLDQGLGLDLVAGFRVSETRDFSTSQSSTELEPSLNVFYKLTPALTASLTVNTDFSGTGADARQINLSRFGLFFPEQRDFFLQDTDIFEFGRIGATENYFASTFSAVESQSGRPFFSRRIGISDAGLAINLDVGAKLTGRIGRWDIGVLDIQQASHSSLEKSNLFVGRAALGVMDESLLGVIVTHGDPSSNLDNTLVGVDFRYLNTRLASGNMLQGALWYQQSDTEGLTGNDAAFGASLKMPSGEGLRGGIGFKELQANFNPALGFVNRVDVRDYTFEIGHRWSREGKLVNRIYSGVDAQRIDTIAGDLQSEIITVRALELETPASDALSFSLGLFKEQIVEPFEISEGIFIPSGTYSFSDYCLNGYTGNHRSIATYLSFCDGEFYDGNSTNINAGLIWRPNPHFKFDLNYNVNDIDLPQGSFIVRLLSLRADVAFSSTWSWENFIQYDNVSDGLGINSILRWLPQAGREMVFVINREFQHYHQTRHFKSVSADVALKLSYTFRF